MVNVGCVFTGLLNKTMGAGKIVQSCSICLKWIRLVRIPLGVEGEDGGI